MTALVVGGSKGIGKAIALSLAAPGKTVAIGYASDDAQARATADELERAGARALLVKGDVGRPDGCRAMIEQVAETSGSLDELVHCAVVAQSIKALSLEPEQFDRALQVNGASLFYLVHAARPLLRRNSSIVFLSSYGSKVAIRGYMALGAPKALAEALIRYLAVELGPDGIRINAVTPAALPTDALRAIVPDVDKLLRAQADATPVRRNPTFEDVVEAVKFLCSPAAGMITGRELTLDGGLYLKA